MTTSKFTNKEEYLQYRKDWKAEYKQLSQQIRDAKFCRWYASIRRQDRMTPERDERWAKISGKTDYSYWAIKTLKVQATNMLDVLKESKQEAHQQYLAGKQQKLVIA